MKNIVLLFSLLFIVSFSLLGCTVKKPSQKIQIKASGLYDMQKIRIMGESNLPKGSMLDLEILNDDSSDSLYKEAIIVEEDGVFNWVFTDLDNQKDQIINLVFNPSKQSKEVQENVGKNGEYIKDGEYSGLIKNDQGKKVIQKSTTIERLVAGKKEGGIFYLTSPK